MANNVINKQLFKKWQFWVIVIVILGVIGTLTQEQPTDNAATNTTNTSEAQDNTAQTPDTTASEVFNTRANNICDTLKSGYSSIAKVTCQDATVWQANNTENEYRDINLDFNGQIAYEVKVIADSSKRDTFNAEYTCENFYSGTGSCITGEAGQDMLYSIIIYDKKDDAEANKLADGLKQILNNIQ